jgi:hypothetical protein
MSLLDMPTDLNLGLDSSSLQADTQPTLTARYGPRGESLHANQQSYPQAPSHLRTGEQAVQTSWNGVPSQHTSNDMCDFSLSTTVHSSFPSTYSRHRVSLGRNMSPQNAHHTHQQPQDDMMPEFDEAGGNPKGSDGKDSGTDSGYGNELSPSDLLQSPYDDDAQNPGPQLRGNQQEEDEPSDPASETHQSNMTSWIRMLSDTNVQLHQHMQSIPVVETGQRSRSSSGSSLSSMEGETRLPVDCTIKLSGQYTALLTSICAGFESCRASNDAQTLAQFTLDQPSQLLILSSYLCLLESYDKILQHIKAWLEVRLKMGVRGSVTTLNDEESNFCFPTQLPSLAVGSFELPKTSSIQTVVLACILETNVMHMHSLIREIMRPTSSIVTGLASKSVASGPPPTEKRSMNGVADARGGLSSVAKVTLQAIEANEDSTLQLVHIVSKLALGRVML